MTYSANGNGLTVKIQDYLSNFGKFLKILSNSVGFWLAHQIYIIGTKRQEESGMHENNDKQRDEQMRRIYALLSKLGANPCGNSFFYTAHAIYVAIEDPDSRALVTKRLYPATAKAYRTNWQAVERNIRILIQTVWQRDSALLEKIAGKELPSKPTAANFIGILAEYLSEDEERLLDAM
ncbi:MAG: sporulation initiation factor Spo0A C-terminal domain-containing protein [Paludibacteraceae bacterium]|nr:sporulation initiation factor Spo0A C-terminal domain-containing protein [Paludibacteraceae bacterium]